MKSSIMSTAWEIAKSAAKEFGGKVNQYFSSALKMAWKIHKESQSQSQSSFDADMIINVVFTFVAKSINGGMYHDSKNFSIDAIALAELRKFYKNGFNHNVDKFTDIGLNHFFVKQLSFLPENNLFAALVELKQNPNSIITKTDSIGSFFTIGLDYKQVIEHHNELNDKCYIFDESKNTGITVADYTRLKQYLLSLNHGHENMIEMIEHGLSYTKDYQNAFFELYQLISPFFGCVRDLASEHYFSGNKLELLKAIKD